MTSEDIVNILLVDDRTENLLALESILGDLGHRLVMAHSGVEALKFLLQQEFAVILLDVQMPGLDGFETAELIRGRERSQHTPIIFLTALDRSDARVFKGYSVGAVDFLFKPFMPDILRSKVAVFVDLFRKTQTVQRQAEELEQRVRERTAELTLTNEALYAEIAERKRAEGALQFLAEASRMLSNSLDYETTLQSVAQLSVPILADWCAVDILQEDGSIRELVAHINPQKVEAIRSTRFRYPPSEDVAHGVPHVLSSGKAELHAEIDDELLRMIARDQGHLRLLREQNFRSYMCVPLQAHGRILGTVTFITSESGRRYGATDLRLAEDLARRAAIAVDNARLYRESQEAILARDEFLSIASHELKTPLTSLQLQVQTLLRSVYKGGQSKLSLERIVTKLELADQQTERLAGLINELLDVARIRSGQIDMRIEEINLSEVVQTVAVRFEEQLAQVGSQLHLACEEHTPVCGDRLRLEQVVTNLLSNAIKYGSGNPIAISIRQTGESVQMFVRDEGIGIAQEHLERIFVRFERAVSSDNYGGLGLGLYIVHQIVEALGGTIRVSSELGRGSTFTVSLPRPSVDGTLRIDASSADAALGLDALVRSKSETEA
ncbi:MAG: response regulator [Chloroflexi bacterium]|nr:response regulator [Chloroflexota bacterium]